MRQNKRLNYKYANFGSERFKLGADQFVWKAEANTTKESKFIG